MCCCCIYFVVCNELIGWITISIDSYEELFSRHYLTCLVSNVESKMMAILVFSANKRKNKLKFRSSNYEGCWRASRFPVVFKHRFGSGFFSVLLFGFRVYSMYHSKLQIYQQVSEGRSCSVLLLSYHASLSQERRDHFGKLLRSLRLVLLFVLKNLQTGGSIFFGSC